MSRVLVSAIFVQTPFTQCSWAQLALEPKRTHNLSETAFYSQTNQNNNKYDHICKGKEHSLGYGPL